ncbi:MAG: hypothetical protein ABJE66_37465 [Deltaproteobacteria bacterium]|jgi:hypothetical protein
MGSRRCVACVEAPVATCGRCSTTRCAAHKFKAGERCTACERDFRDEALTRRAVKLIFAAPVGLFCGGTLFALLSFGGALGTVITCVIACFAAVGAGAGVCSLVDSSARAMFLREKSPGLPAARLLPPGRHHA